MDPNRAFLIVCLTVSAVIFFNVMIYLSLRRRNETTTIDLMRKAARRARDPWKDEDDALQELSNLVSGLKDEIPKTNTPDENRIDQE